MYNTFPYMIAPNVIPQAATSSIFSRLSLSKILSGAGKTLNVVNQAIPLYYQVKPMVSNIRQLGKIGREFTKKDTVRQNNNYSNNVNNANVINDNIDNYNTSTNYNVPEPTFFI